ncbi:MAG: Mur ligase domain-containing protein [Anaerolineae bacterium]|nr:Mur ligase domain-containing protein [Anaerolineae bacterium]
METPIGPGVEGRQLTLADFVDVLSAWRPLDLGMPVAPVIDSREAQAGSVFFALAGEHVDGHAYVGDAFSRGAVASVVQHDVPLLGDVDVLDLTAGRCDR